MLYLLAFFLPPVAVLLAGRPGSAFLNFILCLLLYIPGVIHAMLVIHDAKVEKRNEKLIRAMQKQNKAQ